MYNESRKWYSQTLLYYEDHLYQTDGKLRVGISTNSSDDKNFNPPAFNISISHNYQKSCNLNIQQATDLVSALKKVLDQATIEDVEILRRISKNLELSILFKTDQNDNAVVQIILRSSSTDFTKIIIPIDVFSVLAHRLKNFVNNFDQLCYQLLMKNIDGEYGEIIRQLPGLIKGVSSQIIPGQIIDRGVVESEAVEEAPSEQTIAELDSFLGTGMENINISELESKQIKGEENIFNEVKSDLIDIVLQKKLSNLENILVHHDGSKQPTLDIKDELTISIGKDMSYLPNLDSDQLKSAVYISKLLCSLLTQAHIRFNSQIPTSTPILKYKVTEFSEENMDMAHDLLVCFAYGRSLRNRMSDKSTDFIVNKTRFYLQMRCYLDIFCFSFLEKANKAQLRSIISNRYKYFDSIGVFDDYKELLTKYNCTPINGVDIDIFVNEACEKVIGKTMYITEQHDNLVKENSFRIPSSNNFTLEQITNEVIPLEVDEKMGVTIDEKDAHKYASAEVLNYFVDNKEPKVTKTKKEKTSNIIRFATHFRNEIPEQHREGFLEWLKIKESENFSFVGCEFPLAEFGGNIIKGLYLWKPVDDNKLVNNYKYFYTQFEECMLDKDHILALDIEDKKTDEWSNAFDTVTFD